MELHMPPNLNFATLNNAMGFNGSVDLFPGTASTGFFQDPVLYWTPLANTPLPLQAQVGLPALTGTLPNTNPAVWNGNTPDYLSPTSAAQPYVQQWSFGLQYMLPAAILLETDYVGNKGSRLFDSTFYASGNQAPSRYMMLGDILAEDIDTALADPATAATLATYGVTAKPYSTFTGVVGQAVRPFPQYQGYNNISPLFGKSRYDSLQVTGRKRSGHGLDFIASYTMSKTTADTDGQGPFVGGLFSSNEAQDFYDRRSAKSLAAFDITNYAKLSWIYQLPFGSGKRWSPSSSWLNRLVSGWQVSAIQQYYSGAPTALLTERGTGIFAVGVRPDIISGVPQTVPVTGLDAVNGTQYLNPAAFKDPPLSPVNSFALRFGNSSRYLPHLRTPGFAGEDASIFKDTRLNERFTLQLRADFFNVFNRVGHGSPNTDIDSPAFGKIFGPAHGPRNILVSTHLDF
jgi:hypothetical protein